jgi:hypothetical protein
MRLMIITLLMMGGLTLIMEFALVDTVKRTKDLTPETRQELAEGRKSSFGWADLRGQGGVPVVDKIGGSGTNPLMALAALEKVSGDDATLAIWKIYGMEADAGRRLTVLQALGRRPGRLATALLEGIFRSTSAAADREEARRLLATRPPN